jgi:hypothetical protein
MTLTNYQERIVVAIKTYKNLHGEGPNFENLGRFFGFLNIEITCDILIDKGYIHKISADPCKYEITSKTLYEYPELSLKV